VTEERRREAGESHMSREEREARLTDRYFQPDCKSWIGCERRSVERDEERVTERSAYTHEQHGDRLRWESGEELTEIVF
jgi:hypothetical protein